LSRPIGGFLNRTSAQSSNSNWRSATFGRRSRSWHWTLAHWQKCIIGSSWSGSVERLPFFGQCTMHKHTQCRTSYENQIFRYRDNHPSHRSCGFNEDEIDASLPTNGCSRSNCTTFCTNALGNHFRCLLTPHLSKSIMRNSWKEMVHCVVIMTTNEET